MSADNFASFKDTMENLPLELNRNFTLLGDLDRRSDQILDKIKGYIKQYEEVRSKAQRELIHKQMVDLFDKLDSFADDKVEIAKSTYDLVDSKIVDLVNIRSEQTEIAGPSLVGYDMPRTEGEPVFCICRDISHGDMVCCDNDDCDIEWFHIGCVGLTKTPEKDETWYCPDCTIIKNAVTNGNSSKSKKRSKSKRSRK